MTGPTANLNTLAYRRALSTVGVTSGEPPGTPCGPRRISPDALATVSPPTPLVSTAVFAGWHYFAASHPLLVYRLVYLMMGDATRLCARCKPIGILGLMTTQREARSTDGRGGRGARQRILNTATDLFYREGINATGVERLASEASVSKRTLYQHFPSKAAVVEEYLRCIQQGVGDPIRPGPDAANRTPRERILALFETPSPDGQMRGCPFHNAAVEASEVMPEIQDIVHEHKRAYIKGLIKLARQAGAANPTLLGNQLGLLYEGAAALSTSLDDPAPWTHARKAATTLIDQAVG